MFEQRIVDGREDNVCSKQETSLFKVRHFFFMKRNNCIQSHDIMFTLSHSEELFVQREKLIFETRKLYETR